MSTKIRSSSQLAIDTNLNLNSFKVINLATGTANADGVNLGQMNTAIGNAVSGLGSSIHTPVADLAGAKAVPAVERADKMIMNVETLGLYRFDAESMAESNDDTVIRPTDIASDAVAGRWIKMSSSITDHNNLSGIQGGTTGERFHLTSAELTKLGGIEAGAEVTSAAKIAAVITASTTKATPVDADMFGYVDTQASNSLKKFTWANIKDILTTLFDTLYWRQTATGDVTIADNVTAIGASKVATGMVQANAITNTKLAQVATQTFKGRTTAATGDVEDLTIAQARALLGLTALNLAQRKYRVTPSGIIDNSNKIYTISDLIIAGTEEVFRNGVLQNSNNNADYSIVYGATTTITFTTAPQTSIIDGVTYNDVIVVSYSI